MMFPKKKHITKITISESLQYSFTFENAMFNNKQYFHKRRNQCKLYILVAVRHDLFKKKNKEINGFKVIILALNFNICILKFF